MEESIVLSQGDYQLTSVFSKLGWGTVRANEQRSGCDLPLQHAGSSSNVSDGKSWRS